MAALKGVLVKIGRWPESRFRGAWKAGQWMIGGTEGLLTKTVGKIGQTAHLLKWPCCKTFAEHRKIEPVRPSSTSSPANGGSHQFWPAELLWVVLEKRSWYLMEQRCSPHSSSVTMEIPFISFIEDINILLKDLEGGNFPLVPPFRPCSMSTTLIHQHTTTGVLFAEQLTLPNHTRTRPSLHQRSQWRSTATTGLHTATMRRSRLRGKSGRRTACDRILLHTAVRS